MITLTRMTKVEPAYIPPSWKKGTDAGIIEALQKHYEGEIDLRDYWSVGDERTIHLSEMSAMSPLIDPHEEQDVTFVLANAGGKELTTPISGVNECAFIVIMKTNLIYSNGNERRGYFHSSTTSPGVGWQDCDRRTWCNSTFRNAIPSTIRDIFKQHKNISVKGGNYTTTAVTTNDYFALPAANEIMPLDSNWQEWTAYNIESQSTQLEWLETSSNRQGYTKFFTRTPDIRDGNTLYILDYPSSGDFGASQYNTSNALVVVGVI